MKNIIIAFLTICVITTAHAQKGEEKLGNGYSRFSYKNKNNCKTEFQCFDSTFTNKDLDELASFMYKIGAQERGMEKEFQTFRSYDFTRNPVTKEYLVKYSTEKMKEFEKSVAKLKAAPIHPKFVAIKNELIDKHQKRLEFEKIFTKWYASGNDQELIRDVRSYYTDIYIVATLNKTLALQDQGEKWKYTYFEIHDIVNAKIFPYDKLIEIQNKIMFDYKIEIFIDSECKKS